MAEQRGRNTAKDREEFVVENAELLKHCSSVLSKERKQYLRELVAKARVHFGYSEKTISQDIVRPLVRAYSKYVALKKRTDTPRILLHSGEHQQADGRALDETSRRWDH